MTKGKPFPKDIIEHWPEVFGDIKLNVVPLRYLDAIVITFKDGKIWEIKTSKKDKSLSWEEFEENVREMITTYEDTIENVDFKLNTSKVKKDIEKGTQQFLKKKKL
jgi:iron uptake system EfeUOB component EfeO/EfeM